MKLLNYFCVFTLTAVACILSAGSAYADDAANNGTDAPKECPINAATQEKLTNDAVEATKKAYDALKNFKKEMDNLFHSSTGACNYHKNFSGALTKTWAIPDASMRGAAFITQKFPNSQFNTDDGKTSIENAYNTRFFDFLDETDIPIYEYADETNDDFTKYRLLNELIDKPVGEQGYWKDGGITFTVRNRSDRRNGTEKCVVGNDVAATWHDKAEITRGFKKYSECNKSIGILKTNREAAKAEVQKSFDAVGKLDPQSTTTCMCDAEGKVIDCESTADTELEDDVETSKCKPLNEYQAEFAVCPLCRLFATLLKSCQDLSVGAFEKLAKYMIELLLLGYAIYIGLQTLYLVGSSAPGKISKFLTEIMTQGFKVALCILLLEAPDFLYENGLTPVISGGLEFGLSLMPKEVGDMLNTSINEYGTFDEENELLPSEFLQKVMGAVKGFNDAAAMIPALGRALWCNAWEAKILEIMPDTNMMLEGVMVMVFGTMIMLAVGFYLLDCVIELGVVCCLLPLLIACWPFKITRQYAVVGWNIIMNIFFNFVMMGVVITAALELIKQAIAVGDNDLATLMNGNNVYELSEAMEIGGMQMIMLLVSCMIAWKLIKEVGSLANKFAPGAGVQLGAKLGGSIASAAKAGAKTAVLAGGGAAVKGGAALAEASGLKGAMQELKGKVGNNVGKLAGKMGIGAQAKIAGGRQNNAESTNNNTSQGGGSGKPEGDKK